jgi:ABC-type antimicrobial peptide transport system permease subunit
LVSDELARTFNVLPGDNVSLRLPRPDGSLAAVTFHAVGEFKNFPGFPQGIDLVANRSAVTAATGRTAADFFVLRTAATSDAAINAVATALRARSDASSLKVETVADVYNQDQSTLAALNLSGLGAIVTVFAALMSAAAAAIFVATTFAARRKEYVTLQALGVDPASVRRLLIVEGALLVGAALIVGFLVGAATATLDIQILAPLFVIAPVVPDIAIGGIGTMGILVVAVAGLAIAVGTGRISRLRAVELLREE